MITTTLCIYQRTMGTNGHNQHHWSMLTNTTPTFLITNYDFKKRIQLLFLSPFVAPMMDDITFITLKASLSLQFVNLFYFVLFNLFGFFFSLFIKYDKNYLKFVQRFPNWEVITVRIVVATIIHKPSHKCFLSLVSIATMMMIKMKNGSCSDGFVYNYNDGNFLYLEIHFDFRFSNYCCRNY